MTTITRYLLVKATGEIRVHLKRPSWNRIPYDAICVPIRINVPAGWGDVIEPLELDMPEAPAVDLGEAS